MNKITIIKGINKETGKSEIQRVVIFNDNAPVDFQEYDREKHNFLFALKYLYLLMLHRELCAFSDKETQNTDFCKFIGK